LSRKRYWSIACRGFADDEYPDRILVFLRGQCLRDAGPGQDYPGLRAAASFCFLYFLDMKKCPFDQGFAG
jgi:hypothetical protein